MLLSIITVVKDDREALLKTMKSVQDFVIGENYEHLVWWNGKTGPDSHPLFSTQKGEIFCGDDLGIFDAMNKVIILSSGDYCLFLNAGDFFEEQFSLEELKELNGPGLLPVKYIDFFNIDRFVTIRKTIKLGIPYCHQGMILPTKGLSFPTNRKFGGDYAALISSGLNWPLPLMKTGQVRYDNTGISTQNRWKSDMDTNSIISEKFGFVYACGYFIRAFAKQVIKKFYSGWRIQ